MKRNDVLDGPVGTPEPIATPDPAVDTPSLRARLSGLAGRVWFWPTLLTAVLGAARIGNPELWRDELRSWSAASRSVGELVHLLGNTDAAVALYYLLLHYWMVIFGDSATAMRLMSTVAMAATAGVVALIGQRLFDRRTAIIAGLIFATIPAVSRFAQEVRPYALTMLAAAVATLLLLRGIEKPSWRRLSAYGVSVAVLALTQIVALPILAAHAVGILIWRQGQPLWRWVIAAAGGLALAAPVALLSSSQYAHQVGSLPAATFEELTKLPPRLFASTLVAGALSILAVLAWSGKWRPAAFLSGWAVLPIMAIWVASNLGDSYWMSRYMLFTLPAFALLAAAGIARLRTQLVIAMVLALALLGAQDQRVLRWVGSHDQWTYPEGSNAYLNYTAVAEILAKNAQPGDAIVYSNRGDYWLFDIGVAYHMRDKQMPADIFVTHSALERGDFWAQECKVLTECPVTASRVWVVGIGLWTKNAMVDMEGPKKAALLADYRLADEWYPSGIDVWLLERK